MKKTTVLFTMLMALVFTAQAQDTLYIRGPLPYYLHDSFPTYHPGDTISLFAFSSGVNMVLTFDDYAFPMNAGNDSLPIYGIAACMITMPEYHSQEYVDSYYGYYVCDSTYKDVEESLRLYENENDSIYQVGEDLLVHIKTTPVSYYMNTELVPFGIGQWPLLPMYERYFVRPVTVADSFYVGRTNRCGWPGQGCLYRVWPIDFVGLRNHRGRDRTYFKRLFIGQDTLGYTNMTWYRWSVVGSDGVDYLYFPILTPKPDTTVAASDTMLLGDTVVVCDTLYIGGDTVIVNGDTIVSPRDTIVTHDTLSIHDFVVSTDTVAVGDTLVVTDTVVIGGDTIVVSDTLLSVMQPDLLQRLTGVMPSPARDRAKVVSSIGLTDVEVYSLTGRRVHTLRLPAAPLSATLDVSRWPSGNYLLRITTPMGATMKKLTVAR